MSSTATPLSSPAATVTLFIVLYRRWASPSSSAWADCHVIYSNSFVLARCHLFDILSSMGFFFFVFVCLGWTVMLSMAIPSYSVFLSPLPCKMVKRGKNCIIFVLAMVDGIGQGLSLPSDAVHNGNVLFFNFAMVVGNDYSGQFGFKTYNMYVK